jgi:Mn-dependent DtxR family transcriptional regulator
MVSETVTIPKEEYEELIETLEVLMDQDLLRRITISLQEFSQGKRIPFEEVKKRFLED